MARPRPISKKRIKEIENSIVLEVETWLRLKAALDAVSRGNPWFDLGKPEVREHAIAWNNFVRTQRAAHYIEVVYN